MEVGPYRLKDDATLEYNPGSWDEFANIMFIDNPVGTGFSYVDSDSYLHDLPEMAAQIIVFLEKFFAIFPQYEQDDVSPALQKIHERVVLTSSDIPCWRVVRGTAYSLYRKGNTRS